MYQGGESFALQIEGSREDASKQPANLTSTLGTHVDLGGCCRSRLRGDAYVVEGARRLRPGGDVTHRAELPRKVRIPPPRPSRSDRRLWQSEISPHARVLRQHYYQRQLHL